MKSAFAECGLEPRQHPARRRSLARGGWRLTVHLEGRGQAQRRRRLAGGRWWSPRAVPDPQRPRRRGTARRRRALGRTRRSRRVRDGDWLYGRGSGDMKAGLVAMTGAVRALKRAGYAPQAPVQLQSVVEEECTGHGALQCLLAGARADACVIPEPHPDHVTVAQVGVLWFHVDIAGIPAHAARASGLGFNAIDAAGDVLDALRRLEVRLNENPPPPFDTFEHPINFNPGVISGGDWPSTVAATCTLSVPDRAVSRPGPRRPARPGRRSNRRSSRRLSTARRTSATGPL